MIETVETRENYLLLRRKDNQFGRSVKLAE